LFLFVVVFFFFFFFIVESWITFQTPIFFVCLCNCVYVYISKQIVNVKKIT
jgi:hypothetical protein